VKNSDFKMQWRKRGIFYLILGVQSLVGCGTGGLGMGSASDDSLDRGSQDPIAPRGCQLPVGRSTVEVEGVAVDLLMPEDKYMGDLLVLPPWNAGRDEWCMHARFCSKAAKRGYRVIMPEMGKSIYAQAVYPETREDWRAAPTIKWVKERLIPDLRNNFCLLQEDGHNFVLGASAGARGAILLAEEMPQLFVAVAALSGDYNPAEMKGDNIYRGFLGDYDAFAQRWESAENVLDGATQIKAAVYLGHGKADKMVPYAQTVKLYDLLQPHHLHLRLNLPADRGNDFAYWSSECNNILDFFESIQASGPEGAM
jgi:dienelactone hydrolase